MDRADQFGEPCFPLTDVLVAAAFADTTLVVVGAGYAFGWRRRLWRYMCHRRFGLAFGFGFIGLECATKGGYAFVISPYDAGGVVSGVSSGHVASFAGLPFVCPALAYFSHCFSLFGLSGRRREQGPSPPTRSPVWDTGG